MKPRNKFQQQVLDLSKTLPPITDTQKNWAYKHCLEHLAKRSKNGVISCLECGRSWKNDVDSDLISCVCPNCSTKLKVETTLKRVFRQTEYFGIITVCGGHQVLRYFYISVYCKAGEKPYHFCSEVVQRWIAPNGKQATVANCGA